MSSPGLLSSFDPAIFLHSEQPDNPPSDLHVDDIEAACQQQQELTRWKTENGIVIQHRAWRVDDVFRSEDNHEINTPLTSRTVRGILLSDTHILPPSSPPSLELEATKMPFISSPIAYPPTSSPAAADTPRKRRKIDALRDPLRDLSANGNGNSTVRTIGGFVADDDSDDSDGDFAAIKAVQLKRKRTPSVPDVTGQVELEAQKENNTVTAEKPPIVLKDASKHDLAYSNRPRSSFPAGPSLLSMKSSSGQMTYITERIPAPKISYEQLVASRSTIAPGRAQRSYYGIDIHQLIDDAKHEAEIEAATKAARSIAPPPPIESVEYGPRSNRKGRTLMWTEKYRARKFTDLLGDERTHRQVLRWLKSWDPIVFPGSQRAPQKKKFNQNANEEPAAHRKILLLTGPPGLGKTTLAHVCARQAGYEVQEINASDERSRDVVKGRIKDMVGTENVRGTTTSTPGSTAKVRKAGRPVCVIVDEVDGVVSGTGGAGGEGGFIKALLDLVTLDQKNSTRVTTNTSTAGTTKKQRKGDKFRLLRPLILICNDVYAPALRPLRQSSFAEIVHVRKATVNAVVSRMQSVFDREGIKADSDGVRRLCEATWGVGARGDRARDGQGEGDIRSVLVVGEWVAKKLQNQRKSEEPLRLTRHWVEQNVLSDLSQGGASRDLGRGGARDVVDRVFIEGAGFPKTGAGVETQTPQMMARHGNIGVTEASKRRAMEKLREMVDASGEHDRVVMDCFSNYPNVPYQDDTFLSKPSTAYDWLHFHDTVSSLVHSSHEWELAPYLSQTTLAFHHLFATSSARHAQYAAKSHYDEGDTSAEAVTKVSAFSGPGAVFHAVESQRVNSALLSELQSGLSLPLARMYRAPSLLAIELLPYLLRTLAPNIRPVIVNTSTGGNDNMRSKNNTAVASVRRASEKDMVYRAVQAMLATGVRFERARVDVEDVEGRASGGWVLRMAPSLDAAAEFEALADEKAAVQGNRYGVRSVLAGEYVREKARLEQEARRRRATGDDEGLNGEMDSMESGDGNDSIQAHEQEQARKKLIKRDFFGRVIATTIEPIPAPITDAASAVANAAKGSKSKQAQSLLDQGRTWITFHEGYSNAVRKPLTIEELMRGL